MAITPSQQSGLSVATRNLRQGVGTYATRFQPGQSPNDRYTAYRNDKRPASFLTFPPDISRHRIILVGREYQALTGSGGPGGVGGALGGFSGEARMGFVLPLPQMKLVDRYQVEYDDNFAFLEGLSQFTNSAVGRFVRGATGVNVNKFKSVLMQAPMLKRHEFIWKLSPKNVEESRIIRAIVNNLKFAMAPPLSRTTRLALEFPYIFDVGFDPNAAEMYGFKPCVIESLDVDYSGGNAQPSLYISGFPESVVINMNLIEIEFWVKDDYQKWNEGVISGLLNPFDTARVFGGIPSQSFEETPTTVQDSDFTLGP